MLFWLKFLATILIKKDNNNNKKNPQIQANKADHYTN
jgi:hypothetical protein